MFLKLLLALIPFMFFADNAGGSGDGGDEGGDDGEGNTNQNQAGNEGGGDGAEGDDGDDNDVEGLKSALTKERENRKTAQKDVRELRKRIADLEKGGKPENQGDADKLADAEKRAEEAEGRLREANARTAITTAASDAYAIEATAIYPLVAGELDFDDDGEPTNIDDVIADAKERYPKLFRKAAGRGDGGKGNGADDTKVQPGIGRMRHAYEQNQKAAKR